MKEFDIIDNFIKTLSEKYNKSNNTEEIKIDIGDDCAVLDFSNISDLCITTDSLVAGTHFLESAPANSIGHKALAVNLSDIAAMGAIPKWITMALTMPEYNQEWLEGFTLGFAKLADKYNIRLIGGDLTRGPLSVTITAFGIKSNNLLTRSGAKVGDGIFVTGDLGLPSYILELILAGKSINKRPIKITGHSELINSLENKLYYPEPRVNNGIIISEYASACIDISDGLLADLGHILKQSNVAADLYIDKLPVSNKLKESLIKDNKYILSGGDEYELLFTAPMENKDIILNNKDINASYIGNIIDPATTSLDPADRPLGDVSSDMKSINIINSNGDKINLDLKNYNSWLNFE